MPKKIVIFSDRVVHWNFIPDGEKKNIYREWWGLQSLQHFYQFAQEYFDPAADIPDWQLMDALQAPENLAEVNPTSKNSNHAFATWKQYKEGSAKAWRVENITHVGQADTCSDIVLSAKQIQEADLAVVQDWGLDIRNVAIQSLSAALKDKWMLLRSYPPIFQGPFWDGMQTILGKRSVLLLRADDLRHLNTSISKGLSWEQTVEDVINEIYFRRNIALHSLRTAEYVILSFGCTGSLLIHNQPETQPEIAFFFDPQGTEGYWEEAHPGYLPGDLDLLAVLLSKEILEADPSGVPCFDRAIRAHLLCRRSLLISGGSGGEARQPLAGLKSVLDQVYGEKQSSEFLPVQLDFGMFANIFGQPSAPQTKSWSLLGLTRWDFYSLARKIALAGPKNTLKGWNIPVAQYNYLVTVDRKEMEFLHHLKSLISEYLLQRSNQPLSIAVFGSPGSGKSFSIKQLAKALDAHGQEIRDVTFNLSQFNQDQPQDLYQAFHVVRDISLSGKIPLVFWDEFDSKNLAWLRYFLAPMQDGEFQEGQLIHSIGKSIFVFAGGTSTCMEQFEEKTRIAVAEKGPDFLSRVKGYINVLGPNPVLPYRMQSELADRNLSEAETLNYARSMDPEFIIRRALLINSLLMVGYRDLFKNGTLEMDDGVLNALLQVPQFKHGTRSLETIFKTSQLAGKTRYHRSDLPPVSQMNLHVNGQEFYELMAEQSKYYAGGEAFYHLVNEIVFDESVVENMAVGVHTMYSLIYAIDKDRDPAAINRAEFREAYEKAIHLPDSLPADEVSQNYHNARKIPEKLAALGLCIVPITTRLPEAEFSLQELEKISQLEHIRWVRHHIDAGWKYAPTKQKSIKLHDALVAWDEQERASAGLVYGESYAANMGLEKGNVLNEDYKDLDRLICKTIPWMLEIVGYKMVRVKDNRV